MDPLISIQPGLGTILDHTLNVLYTIFMVCSLNWSNLLSSLNQDALVGRIFGFLVIVFVFFFSFLTTLPGIYPLFMVSLEHFLIHKHNYVSCFLFLCSIY